VELCSTEKKLSGPLPWIVLENKNLSDHNPTLLSAQYYFIE